MKNRFSLNLVDFIASGFYSGHFPFASGTFGTLIAAALYFSHTLILGYGPSKLLLIILAISSFFLGMLSCKLALKNNIYPSNDDPSQIVIDEFAGFFTTMAFLENDFLSLIIGFFCFRFFDILKPPPVKQADQISGPLGIMLDDVLAGIYAGLLGILIYSFINPLYAKSEQLSEEFNINYNNITNGKLAFSYEKGEDSDLYYIDFSNREVKPLATGPSKQSRPCWSPNGEKISYTESDNGQNKIIVLDLKSSQKSTFGANENLNFSSWAPDNNRIIAASNNSLFIIDTSNSTVNKLISPPSGKKYSTPVWSPRGDEIIYVTNNSWPGLDLELLDLKSKKPFTLSTGYQDFFLPSWHPSGGSFLALYGLNENVDIWDFQKGSSSPEILFQRDGQETDPIWSEDGEIVFFSAQETSTNQNFQIYIWIKSQSKIHQITKAKGSAKNLSWTPITEH